MTVNTEIVAHSYSPGDAMAAEGIPFPYLDASHVVVTHIADATGVRTAMALGSDYTLSGDGAAMAGTITATAEWPDDDVFELVRETVLTQLVPIPPGEPLPARDVEQQLDRVTMAAQERRAEFDAFQSRALRVAEGEVVAAFPGAASRGDTLVGFGADGDLTLVPLVDVVGVPSELADPMTFANKLAIAAATIPADVQVIMTRCYSNATRRGGARYRRKLVSPEVAPANSALAWVQSADGAYWDIEEPTLNPYMFGAVADGIWGAQYGGVTNLATATDDTAAIQAMFEVVTFRGRARRCDFAGGVYYLKSGADLPRILAPVPIVIDGSGAVIATDQPNVALLRRDPADQTEAEVIISQSTLNICNLLCYGDGIAGTVGMRLGALYTAVVQNCAVIACEDGIVGTFCLGGVFVAIQMVNNLRRPFILQSGVGEPGGSEVWDGASASTSASNVNLVQSVRVAAYTPQEAAFSIFASDGVRLIDCISEGTSGGYDVHFDSQGSTTVKRFEIYSFHCENPSVAVHFRIRGTGDISIGKLKFTHPIALVDARGSLNAQIKIHGVAYLADLPPVSAENPNRRLFFHSEGGGWGGAVADPVRAEGGVSSGCVWEFYDFYPGARSVITDPAKWENGALPVQMSMSGWEASNGGRFEFDTAKVVRFEKATTYGDLPAAPAGFVTHGFIIDGSTATFNAAVTGGGSNVVSIFNYNNTGWKVGG